MRKRTNSRSKALIDDEILKSRVREMTSEPKSSSKAGKILTHPLTTLIAGFILTVVLGGYVSARYTEWQKQQDDTRQKNQLDLLDKQKKDSDELNQSRQKDLIKLQDDNHKQSLELQAQKTREQKEIDNNSNRYATDLEFFRSELQRKAQERSARQQKDIDYLRNQFNIDKDRELNQIKLLETYLPYTLPDKSFEIRDMAYRMIARIVGPEIALTFAAFKSDSAAMQIAQSYLNSSDPNLREIARNTLNRISEEQVKRILAVISIFETADASGSFIDLKFFLTSRPRELLKILENYSKLPNAALKNDFNPYLKILRQNPQELRNNASFLELLDRVDDDTAMLKAKKDFERDDFFKEVFEKANELGIHTVLGIAAIYDSFVHGGFEVLKNKTTEEIGSPLSGTDEKTWIKTYLKNRIEWFSNHRIPIMRRLVYRPNFFLNLAEKEKWDLTGQDIKSIELGR